MGRQSAEDPIDDRDHGVQGCSRYGAESEDDRDERGSSCGRVLEQREAGVGGTESRRGDA